MRNYDSPTNQRIKEKFIEREVICCDTVNVEYILNQNDLEAPFSWEDVENTYEEDEDGEEVYREVFEWWRITEWLYRKLREKGEVVLEGSYFYYWGRCCTGQSISLDSIIDKICEEMEIFEGQKFDWSKK